MRMHFYVTGDTHRDFERMRNLELWVRIQRRKRIEEVDEKN